MKSLALALLALLPAFHASAEIWQDEQTTASSVMQASKPDTYVAGGRLLRLNLDALQHKLSQAPNEFVDHFDVQLKLPLPKGGYSDYRIKEVQVMAPQLAARYPDIKTYRVINAADSSTVGSLDITPDGVHAMFLEDGEWVFINPTGADNQYQSFNRARSGHSGTGRDRGFSCSLRHRGEAQSHTGSGRLVAEKMALRELSFGTELRTYRLAVASTGEFTQANGGTKATAMSAIVTGVNRISLIFERDFGTRLQLVADNDKVIYTDPATDPFDNPDTTIDVATGVFDSAIGSSNYDLGHVFESGAGGVAGLGVACSAYKGDGVSGNSGPASDGFFVDIVAHEMGHQLGANHSFNSGDSSCGENRAEQFAFEPGSGTTIMSYAGICGADDVQQRADAFFHTSSIEQIRSFVTTGGSACGAVAQLNNEAPSVNAGTDTVIPKSTPFSLTGTATDSNAGDALTYTWEQMDLGPASDGQGSAIDTGSGPLFRSFMPGSSPTRIFPRLEKALAGAVEFGEVLPTTARDLNFRLTVRDGNGGVGSGSVKLTVDANSGPFSVTAPTGGTGWAFGSQQTVSWNVANTNNAPVSCAAVELALSTNAGVTFDTVLAASTPNDGNESVTVPRTETTAARIRVSCTTQPFLAFNTANFAISQSGVGAANQVPVANDDSYTVGQDSAATALPVLDNDSDPDNDILRISATGTPSGGGTVSINGTALSYKPASGFSGSDVFSYTIDDGKGGTANASVTVIVTSKPGGGGSGSGSGGNGSSGGGGGSADYLTILFMLLFAVARHRLGRLREV
ncbi:MAG: cadherin-like domain-containing protein [Gammaproteobacteria bacterium]|nr:cadherin-like domain-containing protein [Gammaproteobacteria bacterium]